MSKETIGNRTLEVIIITTVCALVVLFFNTLTYRVIVLNLFFLPVVLAGFYLGRYRAGVLALFCAMSATVVAMLDMRGFSADSPVVIALGMTIWGAVLGLTALMVGTLSDERSARTTELHEAHVGVVEVLSKYLQSANSTANNRSRRIAQLCQKVAESMKLSKDDIDNVRIAALMRDMENIEITARVIRKAVDNLGQNRDSDEHTFHGSDLVHSLGAVLTGAFPLVQNLYESDDEFPDGSPSPSRDAADSPIPFGSQIIRAVWAYDALIQGGWGQSGGTPRDAITLLQNDSQTNYHPMVLDHLQRIVAADEPALPTPPNTAPEPELAAAAD